MNIPHKARYIRYLRTMYYLIRHDLRIFKESWFGKFIDTAILLLTILLVFGYFFTSYGLPTNYGAFILVGVIAGFGFYEVISRVSIMIADLEGDRTILYTLTLPIPSYLVFISIAISWALISSIISLLLLPLGKIALYSQFDLSKISLWKFPLIFLMSNLFFGFFALWLSSIFKNMNSTSHLYVRVINPMYLFGSYLYSWQTVYDKSPIAAYLHFINPLLYVMEGMRGAMLGAQNFLPFWLCFTALLLFTIVVGYDAIRRLHKRLDCVTGSYPQLFNSK